MESDPALRRWWGNQHAVAVFLMISFFAVATWLVVEIRWWQKGQHVISRHQFVVRLINGLVVLAVLSLVFVGRFLVNWDAPVSEVVYWAGILVMVALIMLLAIYDWRSVLEIREQKQKELYEDLVRSMKRGSRT